MLMHLTRSTIQPEYFYILIDGHPVKIHCPDLAHMLDDRAQREHCETVELGVCE